MKNLFAAAALMAVGTVGAQELKYGDLNYFFKKGQLDAGVALNMDHGKQVAELGAQKFKLYSMGYIANVKATYGVFDKLNVFAQTQYAYELNTDDGADGRSFNSDGIRNVGVGADYRFFNQNDHLFNFDLGAVVKFPIEDAVRGVNIGAVKDGNFADPSNTIELNAKAGRKWDLANEVFFLASVVYNLDSVNDYKQKTGGGDSSVDFDSSIDYKLTANYQWRPVNTFMVGFGAGATLVGEKKAISSNINFDGTQESHVDLNFNFLAKYLVTDHMILTFNLYNSRLADYEVSSQVESTKRTSYGYGLGVNYLFE